MADAIRVSDGSRWVYVPAGGEHQARLERFAAAGMAEISDSFVVLKHEAGPMFWEMLNKELPKESNAALDLAKTIFADRGAMPISADEALAIGESDEPLSYNKFAKVSLIKGFWATPVDVSAKPLEDGQIVMTIWPESKRVMPARVAGNRRFWLELPESQKKGERCFVVADSEFVTVSFESDGSDKVLAMNPNVLHSWLVATDCKAMKKMGGKFSVDHQAQGQFVIKDKDTGKAYAGTISSAPSDLDNFEFEKSRLERILASRGLGAILPLYVLRRAV